MYGFEPQDRWRGMAIMYSLDVGALICGDMKRTEFEACLDRPYNCVSYFLVYIVTLTLCL